MFQPNLYPTVGLQTPGEVVDANFGQSPFVFDIEDMMKELRAKIRNTIYDYPIPDNYGQWQSVLQKYVFFPSKFPVRTFVLRGENQRIFVRFVL